MCDPLAGRDDCGILTRDDGASIAYRRIVCPAGDTPRPTVVFLHGLMSDMEGGKAIHLARHALDAGFSFLRFDTFGHGKSSGAFTDGTIGRWRDDALAVIDTLTAGPLILVGSSMGGWVALLAARARPERVKALLLIAPAPDFTENAMWAGMNDAEKAALARNGIVQLREGDRTYPVSRALIEDGREHLLLRAPIPFAGPVRILQGMRDESVDWRTAPAILDRLQSADVTLTLVKDGDHRLSRPQDLSRLTRTLDLLIHEI
jgi:pimeloyl-ACP methyl ester carboxylesterase